MPDAHSYRVYAYPVCQGKAEDTVNLDNGDYAELLVHFDGYRGKYVFHCHSLEHEDMQMMGNFQVT